jgi:hypothetical protein
MKLIIRSDNGRQVVELKTAASHALLWLMVFLIFWLFKAGRITYHRLRIKYLRIQSKRRYFQDPAVTQEQDWRKYR